jgi:hypothetical protein
LGEPIGSTVQRSSGFRELVMSQDDDSYVVTGKSKGFCDAAHIIPRAKGHSVRSQRCCPHPTLVHPISPRTTHQGLRRLMSTMCEMVEGFSRPGAVAFLKVRDKDTQRRSFHISCRS